MNYSHQRCEILGGSGGMLPQKILKTWNSKNAFPAISCILEQGIRAFEQKRKHAC